MPKSALLFGVNETRDRSVHHIAAFIEHLHGRTGLSIENNYSSERSGRCHISLHSKPVFCITLYEAAI